MKTFIVQIDWFGPYTRRKLSEAAVKGGYWSGMYLAREASLREEEIALRYIGVSFRNYPYRIRETHHKLDQIPDPEMYGGLIYYHNAPDVPRIVNYTKYHDTLKYAETILAYLLQPAMNDTDVFDLPIENALIVNRWFDGTDPDAMVRCVRGDNAIPDYIEYEPKAGAKFVWLDQQPKVQ